MPSGSPKSQPSSRTATVPIPCRARGRSPPPDDARRATPPPSAPTTAAKALPRLLSSSTRMYVGLGFEAATRTAAGPPTSWTTPPPPPCSSPPMSPTTPATPRRADDERGHVDPVPGVALAGTSPGRPTAASAAAPRDDLSPCSRGRGTSSSSHARAAPPTDPGQPAARTRSGAWFSCFCMRAEAALSKPAGLSEPESGEEAGGVTSPGTLREGPGVAEPEGALLG